MILTTDAVMRHGTADDGFGRADLCREAGGYLTQRHRDTEKQELYLATKGAKDATVIWRWGSTPCPEFQSITRDWSAFGVLGRSPSYKSSSVSL